MMNEKMYDWEHDIAPYIDGMIAVKGGFTPAKRGVILLPSGIKVFVKIAVDDMTSRWLKKEIKVYNILNAAGYTHMPRLLSYRSDNHAMAIEYLEGATFEDEWNEDKVNAVIDAQAELVQYKNLFRNDEDFYFDDANKVEDRWQRILSKDNVDAINTKFASFGVDLAFSLEQLTDLHAEHDGWAMNQDTLIHEDIRADNFGYDVLEKKGKLVDWNWLVIGDKSLDDTSLFVHTYVSGFDPYAMYPDTYDSKMLVYLVCFWLDSILRGNETASDREYRLRQSQAKSVKGCIELLERK